MGQIVQLVIQFELSIVKEVERGELCMISEIGVGGSFPRLGLMRLAALELLEKLHGCYGLRILDVYREADLYTSLIKFYAMYPYNDIALRYVTSILAHALDIKLAKTVLNTQSASQKPEKVFGRPSGLLDLEPIVQKHELNGTSHENKTSEDPFEKEDDSPFEN